MATALLNAPDPAEAPPEQRFLLRAVDWQSYQKFSEALAGRHVRLTYDRGNLEFMTISRLHATLSRLLARLIVVLTEELGIPVSSCGDMTCDREDLDRGLEPDECFYIRNEALVRDRDQIDLRTDPPPDLAIEVEVSRSARDRLGIYAALGIPEVWRFDGQALQILQLQTDGQYLQADHSHYFPPFSLGDFVGWLSRRAEMDENSLVRSFRAWVQEQISRGWPSRP